jgi:hypothetical protein
MKNPILSSLGLLALLTGACEVHDNTINATANIPDATLNVKADTDVDNVQPSQPVPMTVTVTNVYLVEPTATVPPEHEKDAGHLRFYLDDETKPAVLVTAQTSVAIPIPADTKPGKHKVICRVHKHNGEATTTKFEVNINVKVAVTTTGTAGTSGGAGTTGAGGAGGTTGAAGTGPDGGTTVVVEVDASVTTTTN